MTPVLTAQEAEPELHLTVQPITTTSHSLKRQKARSPRRRRGDLETRSTHRCASLEATGSLGRIGRPHLSGSISSSVKMTMRSGSSLCIVTR